MKTTTNSLSNKEIFDKANVTNMKKNIKLVKNKNIYFIMNLINGAVVSIDFDTYKKLKNYFKTLDKNYEIELLINEMDKIGFFDNIKDERQAYFHITDRCNLNCIGCYSSVENRNNLKEMHIDNIKIIFEELKKNKVSQIIYSGGEPTLRDDISTILKMAKENFNFTNILISNGSKEINEDILKYLDTLSLSIDDFKKEKNELGRIINYESILNNIEKCKMMEVPVNGIITIHKQNVDKIDTYFEMSRKYKLPISFSIFYPTNKKDLLNNKFILTNEGLRKIVESSFEKMSSMIEGISSCENIYCRDRCEVGRSTISINSSGDLNPCHMLPDIDLGNLLKDAESAWKNLEFFIQDKFDEDEECNTCQSKYLCGYGCRSRAYYNKSLEAKDPYCVMYKLYYDKLLSEISIN